MPVVAPIPNIRQSTAADVNPKFFRIIRSAKIKSCRKAPIVFLPTVTTRLNLSKFPDTSQCSRLREFDAPPLLFRLVLRPRVIRIESPSEILTHARLQISELAQSAKSLRTLCLFNWGLVS